LWEGEEPRAVVPSQALLNAENPVEATTELALASPYAFGIGITTINLARDPDVDEDEYSDSEHGEDDLEPLPLYYVSPKVAKERPDEVKAGWYVQADPGKPFIVTISPLHGSDSVQRTTGRDFDVVLAHMKVDGKETDDVDQVFDSEEYEEVPVRGFSETAQVRDNNRRSSLRQFQFYKPKTTTKGVAGRAARDAGQIKLFMVKAKYGRRETTQRRRKVPARKKKQANSTAKAAPVNEETAIKWGLSVGVSGEGATEPSEDHVTDYKITKRKKLKKNITIFVREKFWLESRRIIENGKAYIPPPREEPSTPEVVDLENPAEPDDDYGDTNGGSASRPDVKDEWIAQVNVFAPGEIITLD